ncbi:hypothetical protein TNCV_1030391 [Trichonephila clavipes]|nr:hypothetical protein TNCV_1030391 [Trichonephila clavipes]
MASAKPSKSSFISHTVCLKQSSTRKVFFKQLMNGACLQEELISFLTQVAIPEKVRQPACVESSWLPSRAKPSVISFPQTFTWYAFGSAPYSSTVGPFSCRPSGERSCGRPCEGGYQQSCGTGRPHGPYID